jgi:PAS domain S-box-containing protein
MDAQTSITFLSILAGSFSLGISLLLWQYRALPSAKPLMGAGLAVALWAMCYTLEIQSGVDLERMALWYRLKYVGLTVVEVCLFLFTLDYIGQRILRRRNLLLLILPSIALFFLLTDNNTWRFVNEGGLNYIQEQLGGLGRLFTVYQYGLLALCMLLVLRRDSNASQRFFAILAFGLPMVSRLMYMVNPGSYDLTPLAYTFTMAVLAFGFLRIGVFDVLPDAYDTVVRNNPDGVLVVDTFNRILTMNPTLRRMLDVTDPRAVGQMAFQLLASLLQWMPDIEEVRTGVTEVIHKDRNIELRIIPLFNGTRFIGRAFLFRDITDRKRAENAMTESEARYRTLFEQAQDAIIVEDHRMRIIDANRVTSRMLGYTHEELLTLTSDMIQPDTVRLETPDVKSGRFEMQLVRRDKSRIDMEVTIAPIPDKDRLLYMSILRDVTERKRDQNELKKRADELAQLYEQVSMLEQYKTDMIRMAAHDLRHPISVALGYAELLNDPEKPLNSTQEKYVSSIRSSILRANSMLSDILSLERIEQQALQGIQTQINFHMMLGEIIAQYRDQARQKNQTLFVDVDPDEEPYDILGDAPQLTEAVSNLLVNALKYTPEEGKITIKLTHNGNQMIFEVRDTGPGIPKDRQEKLFRPFYRAKTNETSQFEGTGLGLHLVKNIIERHKGQVFFKSVHGEGSMFGFRIPLVKQGMPIPPQIGTPGLQTQTVEVSRVILPTVD